MKRIKFIHCQLNLSPATLLLPPLVTSLWSLCLQDIPIVNLTTCMNLPYFSWVCTFCIRRLRTCSLSVRPPVDGAGGSAFFVTGPWRPAVYRRRYGWRSRKSAPKMIKRSANFPISRKTRTTPPMIKASASTMPIQKKAVLRTLLHVFTCSVSCSAPPFFGTSFSSQMRNGIWRG